ncbi:MAG TPA: hypothetical protein PKG60_10575 [Spirochaetota bacterium]|nr:hypothetical protein [Spirochaetota bacterium]HPS87160.1 hypothetical protein [Spirochaetota bacterium]
MKKVLALLFAVTIAGMVSCSKSPEAEAKALMTDMTKVTESAADKIEKSANAKEAGDALVAYAQSMKQLAERGKDLEKKFPDFKPEQNDKFKAEQDAMMKSMEKFTAAMTGVMKKYPGAKEIMDATVKMSEIMRN